MQRQHRRQPPVIVSDKQAPAFLDFLRNARAQFRQQEIAGLFEPGGGPAFHPDKGDLVIFVRLRGADGWHGELSGIKVVIPRESGGSSTPRSIGPIAGVSEYWVARSSRAMTYEMARRNEKAPAIVSRGLLRLQPKAWKSRRDHSH